MSDTMYLEERTVPGRSCSNCNPDRSSCTEPTAALVGVHFDIPVCHMHAVRVESTGATVRWL